MDPFKPNIEISETVPTKNLSLRKPQVVVLHYTAGNDESSQNWLSKGSVSAHYLIKSDSTITQIVPESHRAWHAGVSSWRGMTDLNSLSLGVEIVGWGHNGEGNVVAPDIDCSSCQTISGSNYQWFPYPEKQFQAIAKLLVDFKKRWNIKPSFFIGHSDIALGRKVDPGPLFPWERLHKEFGVGAWPNLDKKLRFLTLPTKGEEVLWAQLRLRDYGYDCLVTGELDPQTLIVIQAFQMHFRSSLIDGKLDKETILMLAYLVDHYIYG